MLALLIYCYAHGIFSSRQIERATYREVAVRFLCANTHPDHDTIATFRRGNHSLVQACFVRVLELARALKILRVGEVAVDGTILAGNASKRQTLCQEDLERQAQALDGQVRELLERAAEADQAEDNRRDGSGLPPELVRAQDRQRAIRQAMETLKEQKRQRARQRVQDRKEFDDRGPGSAPRLLPAEPGLEDQVNLTDPQAQLLPAKPGGYGAGYNAQLAVQAQTQAPLILAAAVCDQSNDRRQLAPMVEQVFQRQPATTRVVVDAGYDNSAQIYQMEQQHGVVIYCPPQKQRSEARAARRTQARQRTEDYRQGMRACMESEFGRGCQQLRATTVEPVFSWIKHTLGFTRFSLRGLAKAGLEWDLVCLAFNVRRIHHLQSARPN